MSYTPPNVVKTQKLGYSMSVTALAAPFLPIFQYTGRIRVYGIVWINNTITTPADNSFLTTGMAVNDDLSDKTDIEQLQSNTVTMALATAGHMFRATTGAFTLVNPISANNVIAITSTPTEWYLVPKSSGSSYIGLTIGSNSSTTNYVANYDIYIIWEAISTNASVTAL